MVKSCLRTNIRRSMQKEYVRMYRRGNAHKFINKKIGLKLHTVRNKFEGFLIRTIKLLILNMPNLAYIYILEQSKCGLFHYDYKLYIFADLANQKPYQNAYANAYKEIGARGLMVADMLDSLINNLII